MGAVSLFGGCRVLDEKPSERTSTDHPGFPEGRDQLPLDLDALAVMTPEGGIVVWPGGGRPRFTLNCPS